jgi:hypothetical protein
MLHGRGYRVNDPSAFLILLSVATRKNICEPRPDEVEDYTVEKLIRASGDLEGDSQIGTQLFIGIARDFSVPSSEIIDFLGIEKEEYAFKLAKYNEKQLRVKSITAHINSYQEESRDWNLARFRNKVALIKTFLYYYARQSKVLFSKSA